MVIMVNLQSSRTIIIIVIIQMMMTIIIIAIILHCKLGCHFSLIIIQCYVPGKPSILIIKHILKSIVVLCEYVLVPSFYLGTFSNNVL
jgi:hypothetical protein